MTKVTPYNNAFEAADKVDFHSQISYTTTVVHEEGDMKHDEKFDNKALHDAPQEAKDTQEAKRDSNNNIFLSSFPLKFNNLSDIIKKGSSGRVNPAIKTENTTKRENMSTSKQDISVIKEEKPSDKENTLTKEEVLPNKDAASAIKKEDMPNNKENMLITTEDTLATRNNTPTTKDNTPTIKDNTSTAEGISSDIEDRSTY